MNSVVLAWPDKALSPNARVHWSKKSKVVKETRSNAFMACRIAGLIAPKTDGKLHLWIDFHPPSNRRIDDDNCLGRFKCQRDGIADYLGIDDRIFESHPSVKEKVAGGCVKVRITAEINGV